MGSCALSAERLVEAPAEVVDHCLADYREHHRAGEFLPPDFTDLQVLRGGVGAGTVIRFTTRLWGRTVTRTQEVSEPEPGRVLVERGAGEGSTVTVEPRGDRARVCIESVVESVVRAAWKDCCWRGSGSACCDRASPTSWSAWSATPRPTRRPGSSRGTSTRRCS